MGKNFWDFDPLRKKPVLTLLILLVIVLSAFYLRIYKNSESPPGFYADEASIAYNAYSILKTGKDEHSIAYPVFFRAFGEYKNPIFIYSLVPFIAFGGLSVNVARMASAFWGTLAVLSLFWLAKNITKNNFYALLAATILTLMPWHLHYSRIAFEAISFPALLILSLCFFQSWLMIKKNYYGALFGLCLGLTFYTYTTARFWIPIIILLLLFLFWKQLIQTKKESFLFFALAVAIIIFPVLFWEKLYPGALASQFKFIAIWNGTQNINEVIIKFFSTFLGHWHPKFLFSSGDINIRHSSQVSSELLVSWSIPFIVGVLLIFKHLIKEKIWQFNLILILTFPLAASLTRTDPIATRTLHATPFFALVIALTIYQVIKILQREKQFLFITVAVFVLAVILEFSIYYYHLLKVYPRLSWMPWHGFDASLPYAISWADQKRKQLNLPFYLSNQIEQAYIQGLFFTQAEPRRWQDYHQAPFSIILQQEKIPPNSIIVLTIKECQEIKKIKILKNFGKNSEELDYCVVQS